MSKVLKQEFEMEDAAEVEEEPFTRRSEVKKAKRTIKQLKKAIKKGKNKLKALKKRRESKAKFDKNNPSAFISADEWKKLTPEQQAKVREERLKKGIKPGNRKIGSLTKGPAVMEVEEEEEEEDKKPAATTNIGAAKKGLVVPTYRAIQATQREALCGKPQKKSPPVAQLSAAAKAQAAAVAAAKKEKQKKQKAQRKKVAKAVSWEHVVRDSDDDSLGWGSSSSSGSSGSDSE